MNIASVVETSGEVLARDIREHFEKKGLGFDDFKRVTGCPGRRAKTAWFENGEKLTLHEVVEAALAVGEEGLYFLTKAAWAKREAREAGLVS